MQLDALAQQQRTEAAQAEQKRQEDQLQFEAKLRTAISMSANVTQTISQQVNNLAQLITGLSLPAPPPPSNQDPPDNTLPNMISTGWLTGQLKLRSQAWRLINPPTNIAPPHRNSTNNLWTSGMNFAVVWPGTSPSVTSHTTVTLNLIQTTAQFQHLSTPAPSLNTSGHT